MRRAARVDTTQQEIEDFTPLGWAKFNQEMRVLYGYPVCAFCEEKTACFCQQCVAPTYDEMGRFFCHACHAEHLGWDDNRRCPTCHRAWPKGPKT